jgi:ketosteroid isomerase-like protein
VTSAAATQHVEIISRTLDTIESGNRRELRRLIDDTVHQDCEWFPLLARVEGGGEGYHGPDGMAAFFEDLVGSFEVRYENREISALGDAAVLLICEMNVLGRESGVAVSRELGVIYEFDDGRLRRGRAYPSHAEAQTAAMERNA